MEPAHKGGVGLGEAYVVVPRELLRGEDDVASGGEPEDALADGLGLDEVILSWMGCVGLLFVRPVCSPLCGASGRVCTLMMLDPCGTSVCGFGSSR